MILKFSQANVLQMPLSQVRLSHPHHPWHSPAYKNLSARFMSKANKVSDCLLCGEQARWLWQSHPPSHLIFLQPVMRQRPQIYH